MTEKNQTKEYFTVCSVSREDIASFFGDAAFGLTDEQMELIASKMGSSGVLMEAFWVVLEIYVEDYIGLEPKQEEAEE